MEYWDKLTAILNNNMVVAGDFEMHSKPGEWYPEHILSWYKHLDDKSMHLVYFEDLKKVCCCVFRLI